MDFVEFGSKYSREYNGMIGYPIFINGYTKDLMTKGRSFYAVWDEEKGLWSTREKDVGRMVDNFIKKEADEKHIAYTIKMSDNSSGKWSEWCSYCRNSPDEYHDLDVKITFSDSKVRKEDYATKRLPYSMKSGDYSSYEKIISTLYDEDERRKLEWAIGSILAGESSNIQKFIVMYGPPGSGKSTMIKIIEQLFDGYYCYFSSKTLGSNDPFALDDFKKNPLIAIDHDGDLSRLEDNTKLNQIISHETMVVNEKYKAKYTLKFRSFIIMGTNKPVRISDMNSGLLRRLIDVRPSGRLLPHDEYNDLMSHIKFELGAIAYHCYKIYQEMGPNYYDSYRPMDMMSTTNDFYDFVVDNLDLFLENDTLTLNTAWSRYNEYVENARERFPYKKREFKNELRHYYEHFYDKKGIYTSVYEGFKREIFEYKPGDQNKPARVTWLNLDASRSLLDDELTSCPAQYASDHETPMVKWDECKTILWELDTSKLHYVKVPNNHIVIDFDLKDGFGEKDYSLNLEAASKWPRTYAEVSKSGSGIHLHYIYDGDPNELSRIYDDGIEIKVFSGNSSLRRRVTKCNSIPVAHISSGLPLKEVRGEMLDNEVIKSELGLRNMIGRNLRREIHPNTKPSMDFIKKILDDAYASGMKYNVEDMRPDIQAFACQSSHQADYCLNLINKMQFKSDEPNDNVQNDSDIESRILFYDVEVFPNLFVVCAKEIGEGKPMIKMINPSADEIRRVLFGNPLVGFNNRDYDNHIIYAAAMGYNNKQLFELSQRIIVLKDKSAKFGEAYNLSYTDIYDYLSAPNKAVGGLKKWEIKLGIQHKENAFPWDQPVPEESWPEIANYCANDVDATEAVWDATQGDYIARKILAKMAGLTPNDTTNQCTIKFIVGNDKNPQSKYVYTDLSTIFPGYEYDPFGIDPSRYNEGVKIVSGKSIYKGIDPGEGGRAIGYPGIYYGVALLDVESMHPHSAFALNALGDEYTARFKEITDARLAIKHGQFDEARGMLNGVIDEFIDQVEAGAITKKDLANALKTAIVSVYGLTSAKFDNKLKDPRNVDNIIAKYGALFMIDLEEEVTKRGYKVVHIKTDSIKIANADQEIIDFVCEYGKKYGYNFDHEATYDRMCLVNDAVYIAHVCEEEGEALTDGGYWTATGTQFQIPYVFKTLFSKEPIEFNDLCVTQSCQTALYLDKNEFMDLPFRDDGRNVNELSEEEKHDYQFIGKVGQFCPMLFGYGGGELLRETNERFWKVAEDGTVTGRFAAATGTKKPGKNAGVYRWLESVEVKELGLEEFIDRSYFNNLVDEAVDTINKYGDFEAFVNGDQITEFQKMDFSKGSEPVWMSIPPVDDDEIPFEAFMNQPEESH